MSEPDFGLGIVLVFEAFLWLLARLGFPGERRAIDIGDYYADFSKAVALLGWKPRIAVADGLKRTLDFYREFGEHYA